MATSRTRLGAPSHGPPLISIILASVPVQYLATPSRSVTVLNFKNGALIAIAAGSLFAAACKKADEKKADNAGETKAGATKADEKTAKVHCMGVNSCKHQGACKTANNDCAGQNGCGGKGFVDLAEEDCKAKGGSVMAKN
jgi:hypothetical protein